MEGKGSFKLWLPGFSAGSRKDKLIAGFIYIVLGGLICLGIFQLWLGNQPRPDDLMTEELKWIPGEPSYAAGIIYNKSKRNYQTILLDLIFYDRLDAEMGRTSAQVGPVKPGERISFKIPISDQKVTCFQIDKITGK